MYKCNAGNRPFIVYNSFAGDGSEIMEELLKSGGSDFNFLCVCIPYWNHDMSPWFCPSLSENDEPCTGGADGYLKLLTGTIIPEAKEKIGDDVSFSGIAGYSLAGLFALYAMYNCDMFSRVAAVSPSLWFPDFKEYCYSHSFNGSIKKIYMSLGDREAKTRHPVLRTVRDNAEEIVRFYREKGYETEWELNQGNHFVDETLRVVKGIRSIIREG